MGNEPEKRTDEMKKGVIGCMTTSRQWREAANVLREQAVLFDQRAAQMIEDRSICGIVSQSGPNQEPLACGYPIGHEGKHAWATLPTFTEEYRDK